MNPKGRRGGGGAGEDESCSPRRACPDVHRLWLIGGKALRRACFCIAALTGMERVLTLPAHADGQPIDVLASP